MIPSDSENVCNPGNILLKREYEYIYHIAIEKRARRAYLLLKGLETAKINCLMLSLQIVYFLFCFT